MSGLSADDRLNYVNMGLMVASAAAAFVLPFELFLFAYAVLGPLHYLTEISWLSKSGFYVKNRRDPWLLMLFAGIVGLTVVFPALADHGVAVGVVFAGFFAAFGMVFFAGSWVRYAVILIACALPFVLRDNLIYLGIFGVFLPTLIHVFVFTGMFIAFGALKSKSTTGYASLVCFLLCGSSFLWLGTSWPGYLTEPGRTTYEAFLPLNDVMLRMLHADGLTMSDELSGGYLYHGRGAVILMRFIAFAYLYHYLNWFSKTRVIKWNDVSRTRMAGIVVLWVAAVGIYARDYGLGLKVLYTLSFAHVFLEFPLNFRSASGIWGELRGRVAKA